MIYSLAVVLSPINMNEVGVCVAGLADTKRKHVRSNISTPCSIFLAGGSKRFDLSSVVDVEL